MIKRLASLLLLTAILAASCTTSPPSPTTTAVPVRFGFTVESIPSIPALLAAVQDTAPKRVTVRFVFQQGDSALMYLPAVRAISPYADIIGTFLDSTAMSQTTLVPWKARVDEYLNILGAFVGTWEIGNEINGEWVDEGTTAATAHPDRTIAKISYAFDAVRALSLKTALTLMYQPDCWEWPANDMWTWVDANIPQAIQKGVDHLWISYYEDVCNNQQFTATQWYLTFSNLRSHAGSFPAIGFGEVGYSATNKVGLNNPNLSNAAKIDIINRYYSQRGSNGSLTVAGFEGQFLYWYGQQDFLPIGGNPLWAAFKSQISQ